MQGVHSNADRNGKRDEIWVRRVSDWWKRGKQMTVHRSFYRSRAVKVLLAMYLLSYLVFLPLADELVEKVREARRLKSGR